MVVLDYLQYFRSLQAYTAHDLAARKRIRDAYFTAIRSDIKNPVMLKYIDRVWQGEIRKHQA